MTAPVTQTAASEDGEKIAMTAPVARQVDGAGYLVAFVVPAKYTLDTVPRPRDAAVRIRAMPAQRMASGRYSGRGTTDNYQQHLADLRSAAAARGLTVTGEPILARYNPAFMPSFLRRNEILIPVAHNPPLSTSSFQRFVAVVASYGPTHRFGTARRSNRCGDATAEDG